MKKVIALIVALIVVSQLPTLARRYNSYQTKAPVSASPQYSQSVQKVKTQKNKVKEKNISDGFGHNIGRAVRDGNSNNFTVYDIRGRKLGTYKEDDNGQNGKFYDLRGRALGRTMQTTDVK